VWSVECGVWSVGCGRVTRSGEYMVVKIMMLVSSIVLVLLLLLLLLHAHIIASSHGVVV